MFDDNDRSSLIQEALEHLEQGLDVQRMEADGGFIKDKDGISLAFSQFTGQFQPLGLPAGKAGGVFAQAQVAQAQVLESLEPFGYQRQVPAGLQGFRNTAVHQFRQGTGLAALFRLPADFFHGLGIPGSFAVRTRDIHVRQELDIQTDDPGAVAGGTAEPSSVVRKVPCLPAPFLGFRCPGKDLSQFIMDAHIGGHGGADVDANGGSIDELHLTDALGFHGFHRVRQGIPFQLSFQGWNQAFQHQGGLAGA